MHIYLYTYTRCFNVESRDVFRRKFRNLDDTEWKKSAEPCTVAFRLVSTGVSEKQRQRRSF